MKYKIVIIFALSIFVTANRVLGQKLELLHNKLELIFENISMIGILGDDYSRIDMRFIKANKVNDTIYNIIGASRTNLNIICQFEGQIFIDSIIPFSLHKSEVTEIDGFICGKYKFEESENQRCSGVFSGIFKQAYRICQHKIYEPINLIPELKINLSEYIGIWQSDKGTLKTCNWADAIIPNVKNDFFVFNDSGEWFISSKYRKKGWINHYDAYFNSNISDDKIKSAQSIEEKEWWNNQNNDKHHTIP